MKLSLTSVTKHLRRFTYGPQLRPQRDWLILLAGWMLLFLVSVGYNLWLFSRVSSGEALGEAPAAPAARTVDTTPAEQVFEVRAAERTRWTQEYRFVDPSR